MNSGARKISNGSVGARTSPRRFTSVTHDNILIQGKQECLDSLCVHLKCRSIQLESQRVSRFKSYFIQKCSTRTSIVVVRLPGKQEMQGSIPCEGDYPFVPFCCHSIPLLERKNCSKFEQICSNSSEGKISKVKATPTCFLSAFLQHTNLSTPSLDFAMKSLKPVVSA